MDALVSPSKSDLNCDDQIIRAPIYKLKKMKSKKPGRDEFESLNIDEELDDIIPELTSLFERNKSKKNCSKKISPKASLTKRSARSQTPPKHSTQQNDQMICCICYSSTLIIIANDEDLELGKLECKHQFCLPCILDWTKVNTSCPLCKRELLFVTHTDSKGVYIKDIPVEPKVQESSGDEEEINLENGSAGITQPMIFATNA